MQSAAACTGWLPDTSSELSTHCRVHVDILEQTSARVVVLIPILTVLQAADVGCQQHSIVRQQILSMLCPACDKRKLPT